MSDPIRRGWTSASNAGPDSLCPGRHLAQRGIPEPPKKDEFAASGQKIHNALAHDDQGTSGLTLEEREVFDNCRKIEKETVLQYFGSTTEPMRVFRHRRHWAQIRNGEQMFEHSGEADVIYRAGTRLLIADYKTLAGDTTESPRNLQLRDLAVLAWGALTPITEVATVIIQPFVTHNPEVCIYSGEDLAQSQEEMFLRVAASNNPDSLRVPGEEQCGYCLAKSQCVEYLKWAGKILPPQLLPLDTPMAAWTPEQRAKAANALGPAFELLEHVKKSLKEGLSKDPDFVPGWALVPGAKREAIVNAQECFNRFTAMGGTLQQFIACISVGKTKLREALNEVTGAKGMGLDKAMKSLTDGIVEFNQNAPSLKKVDK
jgi:hypothetical protein